MAKISAIAKRRNAAKEDAGRTYSARRREIAEAAIRVFNRLGYNGASISAVAAELNTDRASLYYYISSKDELFDEIVRTVIEQNAEMARSVQESDMPATDKLRELIIRLMESYGESYPLLYIYVRENLSHVSDKRSEWSQSMRLLNRTIENSVMAIIEEGFAAGTFRRIGSPRIIAYGVLGVLGWTNRWFRPDRSDISARMIGEIYAETILGGLEEPY